MYKKVLSKAPNGTTYIYLDEPYYDKSKARSSHHRVCVGKLNDDGTEYYNSRYRSLFSDGALKSPVIVLEGEHLLLDKLSRTLGLKDALEEVFGSEDGEKLLQLSSYLATGRKTLSEAGAWLSQRGYSYAPDRKELGAFLSSLESQDFQRFYQLWQKKKSKGKLLLYILNPVSRYSTAGTYLERGMQEEEMEKLPLCLLASKSLPLSLSLLPEAMDAERLYDWLSSLPGMDTELTVITDRSFFSEDNLLSLSKRGIDFTIPVPPGTKGLKETFCRQRKALSGLASILVDKDNEEIHAVTVTKGGKLWEHIYYDALRKDRENKAFLKRLERCRNGQGTEKDEDFMRQYLDSPEAVKDFLTSPSACWALVSDSEPNARRALCQYRTRNDLELHFDDLRNSPDSGRNGLELDAKLFLSFLSLVLVSEMKNQVSKNGLKRKLHYNWKDVLDEVSSYSSVQFPDSPVPLRTAPTETQRLIFEAFKIS